MDVKGIKKAIGNTINNVNTSSGDLKDLSVYLQVLYDSIADEPVKETAFQKQVRGFIVNTKRSALYGLDWDHLASESAYRGNIAAHRTFRKAVLDEVIAAMRISNYATAGAESIIEALKEKD